MHFWTTRPTTQLESWDPDLEPGILLNAFGHGFVELFARLRQADYAVSIGATIPPHADTVVISLEELTGWTSWCSPYLEYRLGLSLLRHTPALVVVRVDIPLPVRCPRFSTLEIMPTPMSVIDPASQVYLPLLPQRGLIRRMSDRGDRVRTVALKAYSSNLPRWIDSRFVAALERSGFTLRCDTESDEPQRWHDFAEVDVILCTQVEVWGADRKPPTKLVNAWSAGAIPICVDTASYDHIAVFGENALYASSPDEVLEILASLGSDSSLAERLLEASRAAGARHSISATCDAWWQAFERAPAVSRRSVIWALFVTGLTALASKVFPQFKPRRYSMADESNGAA